MLRDSRPRLLVHVPGYAIPTYCRNEGEYLHMKCFDAPVSESSQGTNCFTPIFRPTSLATPRRAFKRFKLAYKAACLRHCGKQNVKIMHRFINDIFDNMEGVMNYLRSGDLATYMRQVQIPFACCAISQYHMSGFGHVS